MTIVKSNNLLVKAIKHFRTSLSSNNRHWPSHVLNVLETKYHLRPEEMSRLWYVKERTANGKYRKDLLLIYDRTGARDRKINIGNSSDLYANSDLLLYDGSIFWDGSVYLKSVNNIKNN